MPYLRNVIGLLILEPTTLPKPSSPSGMNELFVYMTWSGLCLGVFVWHILLGGVILLCRVGVRMV